MAIRSFIAIELPRELHRALGRMQDKLRATGVRMRWLPPENIHLTVKFLGDVHEPDLPIICEVMRRLAADAAPMRFDVTGIGAFPPKGAPRVVWAGVEGDVAPLKTLVEEMELALAEEAGIRPEGRAFHPHLTLGRVKSTRNVAQLSDAIQAQSSETFGTFTATGVTLFMSKLTREGSIFTRMATQDFRAQAPNREGTTHGKEA
jgi:2'-5' RNA ligase